MKDALCRAFCESLTARELPDGLAIGTPFKRGADALGFYVIKSRHAPTHARLEDDGLTVPLLETAGVDLSMGSRAVIFEALMQEFGIRYDGLEAVLHTAYVPQEDVPRLALRFVEFLIRMQDFAFFTRERLEDTFRSDVTQSVMEYFHGRAEINIRSAPNKTLINHVADIVIRPPEKAPLALYVGDTDIKALEAVVLQSRAFIQSIMCNVMLVVRTAKPKRIRERTLAIVRDDKELAVAVFPDDPNAALNYMDRIAFGGLSPLLATA